MPVVSWQMSLEADASRWWEDPELHEAMRRIERRRKREGTEGEDLRGRSTRVRGVREVGAVSRLVLVSPQQGAGESAPDRARARPRPRPAQRLGPRPDMIAAWAVVLGVVLLIVALLTAHG
jgi:hypothetical protein